MVKKHNSYLTGLALTEEAAGLFAPTSSDELLPELLESSFPFPFPPPLGVRRGMEVPGSPLARLSPNCWW